MIVDLTWDGTIASQCPVATVIGSTGSPWRVSENVRYAAVQRRLAMSTTADRLDLRLSAEDKTRIRRAAALYDMPVAAFVREAALREADTALAHPPKARSGSLAARLRGRATTRLGTDEIMRLTRGT
jgi:hypothetical protein